MGHTPGVLYYYSMFQLDHDGTYSTHRSGFLGLWIGINLNVLQHDGV